MSKKFKVGDRVKLKYKEWKTSLSFRECAPIPILEDTIVAFYPGASEYIQFASISWWYPEVDFEHVKNSPLDKLKRSIEAEV